MSTPRTFSVSCVETTQDFTALGEVWNRLLWESHRPVPFLTWEWLSTWWEHFGHNSRLFVPTVRNDEGWVVGIAPLRIIERRVFGLVPVRCLEFLGYRGSAVCADHLDFLASAEDREVIVRMLAEVIFAHRAEWDLLLLADLAEYSCVPKVLAGLAADKEAGIVELPQEVCPYLELPERWDSLLASMKKKRRSFVKCRRERLMGNHRVGFRVDACSTAVHKQLDVLKHLHHLARKRKGERGNFEIEDYLAFHRALAKRMAEAGFLYFAQLECEESPVAAAYGFYLGDTLFYYQTGYDTVFAHEGVGSILLAIVIQDAIERLGARELDFLRGSEEYKYFWTARERQTQSLLYWSTSPAGRIAKTEFLLRRQLRTWLKKLQSLTNVTQMARSSLATSRAKAG